MPDRPEQSETEQPIWQKLALPAGVGNYPKDLAPAEGITAEVDLGGLYPVGGSFRTRPPRPFWLSVVQDHKITLQGGYQALGSPAEVAILSFHTDPGAALVDGTLTDKAAKYIRRRVNVNPNGARARVALPTAVLKHLEVQDGDHILMTQAGLFLVLLNPWWNTELRFWDEQAGRHI